MEIPVVPSPMPPYARQANTGITTYLTGSGSPEGVVTSVPGRTYLDIVANALWVKKTGNGNTGWIELVALGPDT